MKTPLDVAQSIRGFVAVHLIDTGVQLDLFKGLSSPGGKTSAEIAREAGIAEKAAAIWLHTAFAFGVMDKAEEKFSLKPELTETLGRPESTKYAGDFIRILTGYLGKDMENQAGLLKTGRLHPFTAHDEKFVQLIVNRGAQRGRLFLEKVLPLLPGLKEALQHGIRVLDVGCGGGSFLFTLAAEFPNSSFVGLDVCGKSIGIAKNSCRINNLEQTIKFIQAGTVPEEYRDCFDLITMNAVLHEIDPAKRQTVVNGITPALKPGERFAVLEFPYPEQDEEFFDPQYQMGVLDQFYELTWGTEHLPWTGLRAVLQQAGLKDIERFFLGDNVYVLITATR